MTTDTQGLLSAAPVLGRHITLPRRRRAVWEAHQLARFLNLEPETLVTWAREGKGPAYLYAFDQQIGYSVDEIRDWIHRFSKTRGRVTTPHEIADWFGGSPFNWHYRIVAQCMSRKDGICDIAYTDSVAQFVESGGLQSPYPALPLEIASDLVWQLPGMKRTLSWPVFIDMWKPGLDLSHADLLNIIEKYGLLGECRE